MIEFTVLQSEFGKLAKTATFDWDALSWTLDSYTAGKFYSALEVSVRNIREFSAVLTTLQDSASQAIIRGALKEGVNPAHVRRLIHDQDDATAAFETAPRTWIMLDVDQVMAINPRMTSEQRLAQIVSDLPEAFHDVSFHYQWSSKSGIMGWDDLSVHLFFELDEPWLDEMLRDRAQDEDWGVDVSLFNPVQLHYTAAPVFIAQRDPIAKERCGFHEGSRDVVSLGTWTRPQKPRVASYMPRLAALSIFKNKLTEVGTNFHLPIIRAMMGLVANSQNDFDEDACRELISEAIEKSGGSESRAYLKGKKKDKYIDHVIQTARKKYDNDRN